VAQIDQLQAQQPLRPTDIEMRLLPVCRDLDSDLLLPAAARLDIDHHVRLLRERIKNLSKDGNKNREKLATDWADHSCEQLLAHPALFFVGKVDVESDEGALRKAVLQINSKHPHVAVLLLSTDPNEKTKKIIIACSVPKKEMHAQLKAGDWVKEVALRCGGKGGGKPELANAYGTDLSKLEEALAFATQFARDRLGGTK